MITNTKAYFRTSHMGDDDEDVQLKMDYTDDSCDSFYMIIESKDETRYPIEVVFEGEALTSLKKAIMDME